MKHAFTVTIRQTTFIEITVQAASVLDAREIVKDYGPDLAAQDFPAKTVNTFATIAKVRRAP